tara:strand:- start:912 stop:1622 length:711 start_codon:yes stop_codon:yes gene_type:complete
MAHIPKRVLYSEFPEAGIHGVTARQVLEAAIDGILPAYHLVFCPVTLYELKRGAQNPLIRDFKKWHGLTVRVPLGVLYTLNFYAEHRFLDYEGKPAAVSVAGPLGMPGMRPEVPECKEYLLWPEGNPVVFDRDRLFFLRDDLESFANGTAQEKKPDSMVNAAAGQPVLEIERPSHLLLIAALMELLKTPRQTAMNQEGIKDQLLERCSWRGLSKRNLEKIFAAANRAADDAKKSSA